MKIIEYYVRADGIMGESAICDHCASSIKDPSEGRIYESDANEHDYDTKCVICGITDYDNEFRRTDTAA